MAALYSVAEVLAATGGRAEGVEVESFSSISIDSREIIPGALFVAIKGDRFDGHDFVDTALANGAAAALVSEARAGALAGQKLIIVPDALAGLVDLARAARARSTARIVAVTGSVGKTTTKEALRAVFAAAGKTHASIRSFNNHWGVPLMLARMPRNTEFGVFEIGMSAAGEISPLSQLVKPHIALITSIAPAHLENFDSLAGIAAAKAEIFDGLLPGGHAVVNVDHDYAQVLTDAAAAAGAGDIVSYGFSDDADVRISAPQSTGRGMQARILMPAGDVVPVEVASLGNHRLANAVAAFCAAEAVGVERGLALQVLADLAEPEGRGAISLLGPLNNPLTIIDESYNANPASMAAALAVFADVTVDDGRKIVVLGDMLELGVTSAELHAALKDAVLNIKADAVFLVGAQMESLAVALGDRTRVTHCESVEDISDRVLKNLDYGDAVMVKGSNSVRLNSLVSRIRDQFGTATTAG